MKVHAVRLYLSGLSIRRIPLFLRVPALSVRNRLRTFSRMHNEKPEPTSRAIISELDEM
jgi:hypothetical protein